MERQIKMSEWIKEDAVEYDLTYEDILLELLWEGFTEEEAVKMIKEYCHFNY